MVLSRSLLPAVCTKQLAFFTKYVSLKISSECDHHLINGSQHIAEKWN